MDPLPCASGTIERAVVSRRDGTAQFPPSEQRVAQLWTKTSCMPFGRSRAQDLSGSREASNAGCWDLGGLIGRAQRWATLWEESQWEEEH